MQTIAQTTQAWVYIKAIINLKCMHVFLSRCVRCPSQSWLTMSRHASSLSMAPCVAANEDGLLSKTHLNVLTGTLELPNWMMAALCPGLNHYGQ